jgi:hypothetical protein
MKIQVFKHEFSDCLLGFELINRVVPTMIDNSRNYLFMILYVNKCEYQLQAP